MKTEIEQLLVEYRERRMHAQRLAVDSSVMALCSGSKAITYDKVISDLENLLRGDTNE